MKGGYKGALSGIISGQTSRSTSMRNGNMGNPFLGIKGMGS